MSLKSSSTNLTNNFLFFLFSELAAMFLRPHLPGVRWKSLSGSTARNTSEAIHSKKEVLLSYVVLYLKLVKKKKKGFDISLFKSHSDRCSS